MNKRLAVWYLFTAGVLFLSAGRGDAQSGELTIHADKPGVKVSGTLYGIFFEEINMAGDGGLYAELIRNRSFQDSDKPDHWTFVADSNAEGSVTIDTTRPMSKTKPQSLKLSVQSIGGGRVGVANSGYFGIGLKSGARYELSLAACAAGDFKGPLTVTLENRDGSRVYARTEISNLANAWKTSKQTLTSADSDPNARLVIAATQPGTVWLDMVSLFPENTWKNRPNGLRPDLAETLEGLRPSFLRFPGGTWVNGETIPNALHWKTTIGPVADRRPQWNFWKYYVTHGLGYHEYLQLAEDLEAEPLFVINCGMAFQGNAPMDKMGEWVQDALDAIEYANGPADSQWGSLRAKAGHPTPFNLKYIEIGNENCWGEYQERYPLFYDAIKAKYPKMIVIADARTDKRPADIVDEHYYRTPEFFFDNAVRYDAYDRKGPKIYVGEYAVNDGCGQGNLRAAIGEAAFMTGLERNSDIVVMASYAPLFANINNKTWNPDLINFDSSRVYGLPSYYVQQMFSRNRGDVVLPASIKLPDESPARPIRGMIGLGTCSTQAEFKDLKVVRGNTVLFQDDFAKGIDGWKVLEGDWRTQSGVLRQLSNKEDCRILVGDPIWSDYDLSLKARKMGGNEGFSISFGVSDRDLNAKCRLIVGACNREHILEYPHIPQNWIVVGSIETNRWYAVRIQLSGPRIRCWLDGRLIHEATQTTPQPLYFVAGRADASNEIILKTVNVTDTARDIEINIEGVPGIRPSGKAVVLTSKSPWDENTLDAPCKVAPVTRTLDNLGTKFRHVFPANSVTVLRLKIGER
jgi:alpha-L-arabinofuranosidase